MQFAVSLNLIASTRSSPPLPYEVATHRVPEIALYDLAQLEIK